MCTPALISVIPSLFATCRARGARCRRWLPKYQWRRDFASDCVAASAEVIIATPEAIAYASIAGLRGQNGLYAAMIGPMYVTKPAGATVTA
jgi:MFS superfamily sulfate permease-like transporter